MVGAGWPRLAEWASRYRLWRNTVCLRRAVSDLTQPRDDSCLALPGCHRGSPKGIRNQPIHALGVDAVGKSPQVLRPLNLRVGTGVRCLARISSN
jgi:hypothetical protein